MCVCVCIYIYTHHIIFLKFKKKTIENTSGKKKKRKHICSPGFI